MRILKHLFIGLVAIILVAILSVVVIQKTSDGPIEFLQGGSFKTGERITAPVTDWAFGLEKNTEFELEGFGTSRTAGYIMHEGEAYMTCDLGFIWNRMEPSTLKSTLHLIYVFKTWHLDALEDGRALIRIDGKIYETQFVKVEDAETIVALKTQLEELAKGFFEPNELGPPPKNPPNDIWFFKMVERA